MDRGPLVTLAAEGGDSVSRLYFAAKAPIPGLVKTRLGASVGMEQAAILYQAFLQDLVGRFANSPFEVAWHIAPGSAPFLRPIIGRDAPIRVQRGSDWSVRQANLFREVEAAQEGTVALAATDSPQLELGTVDAAFAALRRADVVLGPTFDGGYYLVGMHRFHDIFGGVAMSTTSALDQVLGRASSRRLAVTLLDPEFDVDTEEDLAHLAPLAARRRDLAATAAALAAIQSRRAVA